jgi:hypothetical protein
MKSSRKRNESPQFLSGWKDIANYLGKGVRTVQRYERELGLPVRRPAGKPWGSVVATRAELDGWVRASPIREAFRLPVSSFSSASITLAMKAGIEEMHKLRDQMTSLRNEVNTTVSLLGESVRSLHGDLARLEREEMESSLTLLDVGSRTHALDLLAYPSPKKAV